MYVVLMKLNQLDTKAKSEYVLSHCMSRGAAKWYNQLLTFGAESSSNN